MIRSKVIPDQPEQDGSNVSVVVQGPWISPQQADGKGIFPTEEVLRSVRRAFPCSEVIFSTWRGFAGRWSSVYADVLVESDDPGGGDLAAPLEDGAIAPLKFNIDRQIVSTIGGIRRTTRRFVMKLRSDKLIAHGGAVRWWGMFPIRDDKFRVFNRRLLIASAFTRNSNMRGGHALHPSDWWTFGLREDVEAFWNVPLFRVAARDRPLYVKFNGQTPISTIYPEQYLFLHAVQGKGWRIDLKNGWEASPELKRLSTNLIVNNFVVLDLEMAGLVCPAATFSLQTRTTLLDFSSWLYLYRKRCKHRGLVVPPWSLISKFVVNQIYCRFPRLWRLARGLVRRTESGAT